MGHVIDFFALLLLMLVTGVFWGPWFALHRSLHIFTAPEFLKILKTLATNMGKPMQVLMPLCIVLMGLSLWFYPYKNSMGFIFRIISLLFIIVSLVITLTTELPIVNQFRPCTPQTLPADWETIRNKWVRFHVYRIVFACLSFACFITSILFFQNA